MERSLWVAAAVFVAVACSDAVRGRGDADASVGGSGGVGGATQDGGGGTGGGKCGCAGPSCEPVRIASISSGLAVDDAYVYAIDTEGQDTVVKYAKQPDAARVPIVPTIYPYPFVLDATNVYFVDDYVSRVAKSGGPATVLTPSMAINGTGGLALAGGQVLFQGGSTNFYKVAADGETPPVQLETDGTRIVKLIAASESTLYFSLFESFATQSGPAKEVYGLPLGGGTRTQVASGSDITGLRFSGGAIYWLDRSSAVRRLDEGTTVATELFVGDAEKLDGQHFAVDSTHAYWASAADSSLYRVSIEGGVPEPVTAGRSFDPDLAQDAIALDADCVFFSDATGIFMLPK